MPPSEFISEPIEPTPGSFDPEGMARGEAGLPATFTWRGELHEVAEVVEKWVTSTREGGSGELYLRRHWWRIVTAGGSEMQIYFERQPTSGRRAKARWYLYAIEDLSA